ncbi:carbohydrate porin [Bremerella sp. T1]|uniref:carbohydrate porin n=1 Tax=Bremerella sp. TYQ1 TaxID=3119568 RepID=UPI001CCE7B24|nr:carbohydrate porin [Bremerella volcania]UBM38791.1 carbohydrate porin [Bremerella volcania]
MRGTFSKFLLATSFTFVAATMADAQKQATFPESVFSGEDAYNSAVQPTSYYDTYDGSCGVACGDLVPSCGGGCLNASHDSLWTRGQLTGDWYGHRSCLADCGITVQGALTQFYQGPASGGNEQVFRYGDKLDLYVNVDTGKLGLWEGGQLTMHAVDWQLGQNAILDATGLSPVNLAMLTPKANDPTFAMTSLQYTQAISGGFALTAGRINMLDLWATFYPEYGLGVDGFMNMSMMMPMSVVPSLPLVTNGAGIIKAGERGVEGALLVFESQQTPTTVGLDFENGVTIVGAARKYTDFWGLPGSHTLVGVYATGEYTSYDTSGWIVVPGGGVRPDAKQGTWVAGYLGQQQLWADACNPKRHTSLFGYIGFSDPDNSPFQFTTSISIEKFGPFASRPNDRAGIGYFYNGLNSDFQNTFSLLAPIDDLHGGEVYYNAEIVPWFHLTTDLQVIQPGIVANDTAVVLGLRGKMEF